MAAPSTPSCDHGGDGVAAGLHGGAQSHGDEVERRRCRDDADIRGGLFSYAGRFSARSCEHVRNGFCPKPAGERDADAHEHRNGHRAASGRSRTLEVAGAVGAADQRDDRRSICRKNGENGPQQRSADAHGANSVTRVIAEQQPVREKDHGRDQAVQHDRHGHPQQLTL